MSGPLQKASLLDRILDAETRDRVAHVWRKLVCRFAGCRWGAWLPTDDRLNRDEDGPYMALRQCLRCRVMQQGPATIPHEHRNVQ